MIGWPTVSKACGRRSRAPTRWTPTCSSRPGSTFARERQALLELVARRPDVEAVFCSSDVIAVGALLECARQGWAVPGRLAVAGFDDLPIAAELHPALTTIRVPRRAMGRLAAELLLRRLAGETVEPRVVDLGFELIARASA